MRFYPCLLGLCQSDLSRMLFAPVSTARLFSLTVARTATTAQGPTGSKWSSCPRLLQILFCVCCFWFSEIRIREQGVHLGDGPRQLGWARKWERGRGGGRRPVPTRRPAGYRCGRRELGPPGERWESGTMARFRDIPSEGRGSWGVVPPPPVGHGMRAASGSGGYVGV